MRALSIAMVGEALRATNLQNRSSKPHGGTVIGFLGKARKFKAE
jgi:hypothetical protein